MNLLQMNEVSGDEQPRLCPPSNDLTLQDTAGIDRQLEEGPSNPLFARERAFAVWKERGVSAERLSLPPRRQLSSHRQGRPRSQ
jgi:hypothetical protein